MEPKYKTVRKLKQGLHDQAKINQKLLGTVDVVLTNLLQAKDTGMSALQVQNLLLMLTESVNENAKQ